MGKIYCLMGKSSTGKDSIYQQLFQREELKIKKIIPYTTRPMRQGEVQGREYIFCDEDTVERLNRENKIVELRCYDTVQGLWKYFTVDDGQIDLTKNSYLMVGTWRLTLESETILEKKRCVPSISMWKMGNASSGQLEENGCSRSHSTRKCVAAF